MSVGIRGLLILLWFLLISISYALCHENCNTSNDGKTCRTDDSELRKYILYDVNPQEGFNLKRDVYIRLAVFFNSLRQKSIDWKLVLPPWNNLPHWRSRNAGSQHFLPWSLFFNLNSLQSYAPVMETFEFFEDHGNVTFDHVIVLQHYNDIWNENFTWRDKWDVDNCRQPVNFAKDDREMFEGSAMGISNIIAKEVSCISFQGSASFLKEILNFFPGRFFIIEHAEIVLHDYYGGSEYWKCRESMKFSDDLIKIASNFRKISFTATTAQHSVHESQNLSGDPYLCVHLRRRDYILSHPTQVPNISWAAEQTKRKLKELNLDTVFIATDADIEEIEKFVVKLQPFKSVRYQPTTDTLLRYKDGGIAIIEQIICSYARYFIGTYDSTFSFRIQEERELLNFNPDSTFNRLCGDREMRCKQPTRWLKVK